MGLNIKNATVEKLAAAVAKLAGETKTEAIRRALEERRERLSFRVVREPDRREEQLAFLQEVWGKVPAGQLGRRLTRNEEDVLLGYGTSGV